MNVKELFEKAEDGTLTYEQFEKLAKENDAKFTDLNEGNYVSKHKYEDELAAKLKEIETLNGTIGSRDVDLASLQEQLKEAGEGYIKLDELSAALADLQGKYDEDTRNYKEQLQKQSYEFAVKEFANTKDFTSNAAKREFIRSMMDADLKRDKKGNIIGKEDFASTYAEENADSFRVAKPEPEPTPEPAPQSIKPQPQFITSTPGSVVEKPVSLTQMMIAANENPGLTIQ